MFLAAVASLTLFLGEKIVLTAFLVSVSTQSQYLSHCGPDEAWVTSSVYVSVFCFVVLSSSLFLRLYTSASCVYVKCVLSCVKQYGGLPP